VPAPAPLVPFPLEVQVAEPSRQTPAVGQRTTRPDCRLHGLGQTKYIDDFYLPGMLYAKIKRAGVASARIISIDTKEAEAMPGVMAVLTGRDIPCNSFGPSLKDQPVLADERVFYAGDGVAAVAAVTEQIALEALDKIHVVYEELTPVLDPLESLKLETPGVHAPSANIYGHKVIKKGDVEKGFAESYRIFEGSFRTQMVEHVPLEPHASVATWDANGTILVAPNARSEILRITASGGTPVPVTKLDHAQHTTHRWPSFLPDGKHFLYLAANHADPHGASTGIYVASLDGKLNRLLLHSFARAEYASGYILYLRETILMARPFDPDKLDFTGEAVPVAESVTAAPGTWGAIFTASRNGVLAYAAGNLAGNELRWYDRQGRNLNALGTGTYYSPRLSPDGTRLAVDFGDPDREIWVFDLRRGVKTRLTFTGSDAAPVWSPDGTRIAFAALSAGERSEVFDKKSNGEGQNEPLDVTADNKAPTDWSPDGRFLLLDYDFSALSQLYVLPLTGDRKPYPFSKSQFPQRSGHFSPDGRWVAYSSRESGRDEVYVAPFPGPGGKWQVSSAGGRMPRWRRDGRELFFISEDDTLMAAEVETKQGKVDVKSVHPLFHINVAPEATERAGSYDVAADGTRFVVNANSDENPAPITLVLNWPADLKKR